MIHKKASKTMRLMAETVRRIGIRAGILPRNFPKLDKIQFRYIDESAVNFGGYGGFIPTGEACKMEPFLIVNLHYNRSALYFMATLAHEFLHIAQYRKNRDINHGNQFRKACGKYARALGADYYLVFGYDAPSKETAKAMAKNWERWLLDFRNRAEQKSKSFQDVEL